MTHNRNSSLERNPDVHDMQTIDQVVPKSFKEFLVAMIDDDEAAALVAADIGLTQD